jgi:hypothetical protein
MKILKISTAEKICLLNEIKKNYSDFAKHWTTDKVELLQKQISIELQELSYYEMRGFDINTSEGAKAYLESEGIDTKQVVEDGIEFIGKVKMKVELLKLLPTDKETEEWFDENIGTKNDCSASSAVYKFRVWLNQRIKK